MTDFSRLVEEASSALRPLAEITSSSATKFEGGDYYRLYIKPKFKLGSLLLTSREILVLATGFREIQTRAIRYAEQCLHQARGRLEPGMAIVFHLDPGGDEHLRMWGRERGLTILPVFAGEGVPTGDEMEQTLCSGLYSHDPFDLSGPVRAAHQFFGRTEVPDMARRLRGGNVQALFGIRKMGKTSVLNRVLDEAREYHDMACVMLDCSDDSLSSLDAGRLLNSIGGGINDALNYSDEHYSSVIPLADAVEPSEAARTMLALLDRASRPLLLLIDELDYITPSSPTAPHWAREFNQFFRSLRTVYQEGARRQTVFSVVLCGVSSRWFTVESINGVENAALAFVPETYLPPFERAQSIDMIQSLGRTAGLIFSHGASDLIAKSCSDMPSWIRKAGSYINSCFGQGDRPLKLRYPDIVALVREFIDVEGGQLAYSSIRHLFRIYPDLGSVGIAALQQADVRGYPNHLVSALGRYGLLGSGFFPSGRIVEAGLRLWSEDISETPIPLPFPEADPGREPIPPLTTRREVAAGSASSAGEDEWAELLSEVSKGRNVLERQLRDFVLAVLRAECAKRSDGRTPAEMLLAALPVERRSALSGSSAQAAIKTFYWVDLIAVIKKHWTCFDRYFGDRKQLDLYGDIVNDRPDAHAKDIDGADLALQRRAIGWFQRRLEESQLL